MLNLWIDRATAWADQKRRDEERAREALAKEAIKQARYLDGVHDAVNAHGIHAAWLAAQGQRHIKPAEAVVPCGCGGAMRVGVAHYCYPPEVPIDRGAR